MQIWWSVSNVIVVVHKHQLVHDCVGQLHEITLGTATFDHCWTALVDTALSNLRGASLLQFPPNSQDLLLQCNGVVLAFLLSKKNIKFQSLDMINNQK